MSRLVGKLVEIADRYDELQVLAKQLPAGHAGLQYGCQPHVRDAIMLLKEAWDSISPSTIAACWRCLSVTESARVASDCRSYNSKREPMTIEAMCNKLSSLTLRSPSVVKLLDAMDLAVLANAAQKVLDKAATMLSEWLHLEEMGFIDVNDEGDDSDDSDECQDAVDKVQLLNDALLLLQQLHSVGAKLDDSFILDASRDLCLHMRSANEHSANELVCIVHCALFCVTLVLVASCIMCNSL